MLKTPIHSFSRSVGSLALTLVWLAGGLPLAFSATVQPDPAPAVFPDARPSARYRLDATDHGPVMRHGDGPGGCDYLGARDVWVWEHGGTYSMHNDDAGTKGWLACLATSTDLVHWTKKGAVLELGRKGADDSASVSYGVTFFDGKGWHMLEFVGIYDDPNTPEKDGMIAMENDLASHPSRVMIMAYRSHWAAAMSVFWS